MMVFIWPRIKRATDNYHSEGGVVVVAKDEAAARELANGVKDCSIAPNEKPESYMLRGSPEPKVWIMRDAGCC